MPGRKLAASVSSAVLCVVAPAADAAPKYVQYVTTTSCSNLTDSPRNSLQYNRNNGNGQGAGLLLALLDRSVKRKAEPKSAKEGGRRSFSAVSGLAVSRVFETPTS